MKSVAGGRVLRVGLSAFAVIAMQACLSVNTSVLISGVTDGKRTGDAIAIRTPPSSGSFEDVRRSGAGRTGDPTSVSASGRPPDPRPKRRADRAH